jgi:methylmalonyl-CoA mutase
VQFVSIAKLRAARRLWARMLELAGRDAGEAAPMHLHAVTSVPMMSRHDPWVNLLRGAVAAFAAGVGGADAVTVLPFDSLLGRPDAFGRRIARNVSSLLLAESHLGAVADPAGGAYAVEQLTDDVAEAAWAELQRIETEGMGAFDERVTATRRRRLDDVAHRRLPVTGLSEFPDLTETLPERRPWNEYAGVESYGTAFEALRADPPERRVFLATLGSVAEHTDRATFAANLLAAGGVGVDPAGATTGAEDLVAAYGGQPVVCLAGSDRAYDAWGAAAAEALRSAGARRVLVIGSTRSTRSTDVPGWADDSFRAGDDAIAFLTRTREALR